MPLHSKEKQRAIALQEFYGHLRFFTYFLGLEVIAFVAIAIYKFATSTGCVQ